MEKVWERDCYDLCVLFCVQVPGPKRGEIVRQVGQALREKLTLLGQLVSHSASIDHLKHLQFSREIFGQRERVGSLWFMGTCEQRHPIFHPLP